jgi:V/A-type H+-transporting ATPase subunit E
MDSLQAITEEILQEAKDNAYEIIEKAEKIVEIEVEKKRLLGVQKGNEEAQLILKKAEDEAEIYRSHILAEAKIKANWAALSKKDLWIANVLNEAHNKLKASTKSKKYSRLLEKLIVEAGVMVGGRELEVLLNEQDSRLNLDFDKLAKSISEKTGFETKLKLSGEKANIIGGALVRSVNGKLVMDNSFDDILRRREKELQTKIAEKLF